MKSIRPVVVALSRRRSKRDPLGRRRLSAQSYRHPTSERNDGAELSTKHRPSRNDNTADGVH